MVNVNFVYISKAEYRDVARPRERRQVRPNQMLTHNTQVKREKKKKKGGLQK